MPTRHTTHRGRPRQIGLSIIADDPMIVIAASDGAPLGPGLDIHLSGGDARHLIDKMEACDQHRGGPMALRVTLKRALAQEDPDIKLLERSIAAYYHGCLERPLPISYVDFDGPAEQATVIGLKTAGEILATSA